MRRKAHEMGCLRRAFLPHGLVGGGSFTGVHG
jgi:hypothetical protein